MAPPYPGVLLCEPKFAPNPGDEKIEGYFAVVSESWKGIVTSERALIQMLNKHAPARTFKADTRLRILELWVQDCTEYHNHEGEVPESRAAAYDCTPPSSPPPSDSCSPPSSPPPSPFSATNSTDSRVSSPMATPSPSPTKPGLRGQQTPGRSFPSLTEDELAYLANSRPPPGTLSPQRAQQLFARVLGPDAVIRQDAREASPAPPMLYAVAGHQRILSDREQAIDLFKRTPGAELAFSRTAAEIWAFLGENSARRRVIPKSAQAVPRMYASSSGAELTYSYDANEIWVFLAAGGLTT
ncbi:hypothetical protein B0H13DRAFT_1897050 [Mycena leptocephala]|nr:hypothetical protein B0H13DRAFT_1897050 [Mycena leptocephala]